MLPRSTLLEAAFLALRSTLRCRLSKYVLPTPLCKFRSSTAPKQQKNLKFIASPFNRFHHSLTALFTAAKCFLLSSVGLFSTPEATIKPDVSTRPKSLHHHQHASKMNKVLADIEINGIVEEISRTSRQIDDSKGNLYFIIILLPFACHPRHKSMTCRWACFRSVTVASSKLLHNVSPTHRRKPSLLAYILMFW